MESILIAGAGPVGLTMACELVRYGVPVRIIDRAPEPTQTSKALVIWSRTLELIERMGCVQGFLDAGLKAHQATLQDGHKVLGQTSLDHVASPYNFALMIPQRDTERLLNAHLESLGIKVERQVELAHFVQSDLGVDATLLHADGSEEIVGTPWLLGCDGAHSAVRHGLNLEFKGQAQNDDWVLADVRLEGERLPPENQIVPYLHHDGPFVVFPMPGGRARVIACLGRSDPQRPGAEPTLEEIQQLIDRRAGGGFRATDPVWLSNFRINERKVSAYRVGRAFIAGDAAHVHSPAGGQGMNTGMQDAFNLAWKLAMVARGEAPIGLLDSYSAERSPVGDSVLRNATLMTDMATLKSSLAQTARNTMIHLMLGLHLVQDRMAGNLSEIMIHYHGSSLSRGRGAGHRLPPSEYAGAAPGSGAPRWVVYALDTERASAFAAQHPATLEPSIRRPTHDEMLIVRPDGYIGFVGRADDWDGAEAYLGQLEAAV